MPIADYVTRRRNPFSGETLEMLDAQALCPIVDEPSRVVLDARKPKRHDDLRRGSRFGGAPLLPPGAPWPEGPEGPLGFVGQLDFEQLRREHGGALPLPAAGLLSVFYDVENQPWGLEHADARSLALVFVEDPSRAEPREPEDDDPVPLRILEPRFEKRPRAAEPDHHLCGAPAWIQGDPRLSLQWMTHGLGQSLDVLRAAEKNGVDVVGIAKGAGEWKLLWQIDSDDVLFTWGDCGRLYLLIRESDLAARRFEAARCILQCT